MPVAKRGLVFRHFDKAILGVAVLGLLAALVYGVKHTSDVRANIDLTAAERASQQIQQKMTEPEEVPEPPDFVPEAESALQSVPPPDESLRAFVFWPPVPDRSYEPLRVGTDREIVLDFHEPISPDSFSFVLPGAIPDPLSVLEHPYEGDYSKVLVKTLPYPEARDTLSFTFVGRSGKVQHERPIILDRTVDKKPFPPVDVTVQVGTSFVELTFYENPAILGEDKASPKDDVLVEYYEVMRKDVNDPLADFESVGRVRSGDTTMGRRPGEFPEEFPDDFPFDDGPPPGFEEERPPVEDERPRLEDLVPDEEDDRGKPIVWADQTVQPGGVYIYKIRTVGRNTFPEKGDLYTEPIKVSMLPRFDIRLVRMSGGGFSGPIRADVQVLRVGRTEDMMRRGGADLQVRAISGVAAGDAIDPVTVDAQGLPRTAWGTGITLLDCQRGVYRQADGRSVLSNRIIFVGPDGKIQERWEGQVLESTERLWSRVRGGEEDREYPPDFPYDRPPGYPRGYPYD